jgi:folate-binding protein YgfZ
MKPSALQLCLLHDLGFILVTGRDAEEFLHAQLSQRVRGLAPGTAPLAGWHDAKGRVRAIFRVLKLGSEAWLLIADAETASRSLGQLRLFVLRSDVTLQESNDRWSGAALLGNTAAAAGPALGAVADAAAEHDGVWWVRAGAELAYAFGSPADVKALAERMRNASPGAAALAEIRLGLPRVGVALEERYLPQMLNLDLLGAVVFDKGCYPGQEIIARTHNLGAVKRRMRRFRGALGHLPDPGTELVDETGHTIGEVVRAAREDGAVELLAVVRLDALSSGTFCKDAPGTPLRQLGLPYESRPEAAGT